MIKYLGSLLL
uniref:Uncharacterized protein n=1 Tax=Lepeophtheirus salmonis TaxID=72036 RepID=A0A0K2T3A4_LEPSM